jgi:hypothetical protein
VVRFRALLNPGMKFFESRYGAPTLKKFHTSNQQPQSFCMNRFLKHE